MVAVELVVMVVVVVVVVVMVVVMVVLVVVLMVVIVVIVVVIVLSGNSEHPQHLCSVCVLSCGLESSLTYMMIMVVVVVSRVRGNTTQRKQQNEGDSGRRHRAVTLSFTGIIYFSPLA